MKTNRMVAKMLLAVALVGAVTPIYAQTTNQAQTGSIGHSVSFGSVVSYLFGIVRSMAFDSFIFIPSLPPPPPPPPPTK